VNPTPVADFSLNTIICEFENTTINFTGSASPNANYDWNFGNGNIVSGSDSGPYQINFADSGTQTISLSIEDNSCNSNISTKTIEVQEPLVPTSINCSSTVNSVTFTWDVVPNATNYQVNVLTGQTGILDGTTYHIDNLNPNEAVAIEVIVEGNTVCGNITLTGDCIAQDCPMISVDIEPVSNICLSSATQPIQLSATAGNNLGTFSYSGNGVSNTGVFDPAAASLGTNVITVQYTDGTCSYTGSTQIVVNQMPTADFVVSTGNCVGENAIILYNGSASNNANFNWNFGGGNVVSGANAGPYELSFFSPGVRTVSLFVEENGCTSITESNQIQIDPELSPPVISCQPMLNEISFQWGIVPNAADYQVQVMSGQTGILNGTEYTVSGLSPGEQVTITVIANSANSCPSVSSTFTCESINCPPIDLTVEPVQDIICAGDSTVIQLIANNSSTTPTGFYTWSGVNVSPNGEFSSFDLPAGEYQVNVEYNEMGCIYQSSQIVTIESSPEINATLVFG